MPQTARFSAYLLVSLLFSLLISCTGTGQSPPVITPRFIATLPHDTTCFTQGFFYDRGKLFESDGLYGNSHMRILDAQGGAAIKGVAVDPRYFAEGCAKMGDAVVQITWREQTAFCYSLVDLAARHALMYSGEGWGLTSDGTRFYMSTGSDTIFVRSADFALERTIPVTLSGRPILRLNELEFARGKLYANVWYSDSILEISPATGRVVRIIDCRELVRREAPSSDECVLNGIAFDSETGRFYLTGKKWKKIFVVEIGK